MYALSSEAKKNIQSYTISGTVGDVAFNDTNILRGSLKVNNRCSDSSTFRLGGVYIGQLNVTFIGLNIVRNDWIGKEITFSVTIGENTIPVGTFYVDSAKHTKNLVAVTAYDAMIRLDKIFGLDVGAYGQAYDMLKFACDECGVDLGMSRSEIEALPNGTQPFVLEELGDIETWRDFVYWLAVSLCSFATIDRSGSLVLRTFHKNVDDTINPNVRYSISGYGDEIITYTGAEVFIAEDSSVEYYPAAQDTGYTLNIGENPFMQGPKEQRSHYMENIVANLSEIEYNPCEVTIPFGIHYDLGDVLKFPSGQGSETNLFCIMAYSWTYYGEYKITGIAGQKQSKNKTDKNLQSLLNNVGKNEFTSYEQRNLQPITIGDGETERLLMARIASNKDTKAEIQIEINLESVSNSQTKEYQTIPTLAELYEDLAETLTKGIVTYRVNSEDSMYYPTESWVDGQHVLHLQYILPVEANTTTQFDVYMTADGGTIDIDTGGIWFYASGAGLVGDGKWDGTIKLQDNATAFTLVDTSFKNANDSVTTTVQVPTGDSISDSTTAWTLIDVTFENATDSVFVETHSDSFPLMTEEDDALMTEDGLYVIYTEGD